MSSPNFIWYHLANTYFPKELLVANIMEDLARRMYAMQAAQPAKSVTNFMHFAQEIKKMRCVVHCFGEQLNSTNLPVS